MNRMIPYFQLMRFHRPIGFLLLLWPTLWALWLAQRGMPSLPILLIFLAGVIVMRAAGCVVNDMTDRKFDRYVVRTRERPLTSGRLPMWHAAILLLVLLALGLVLLIQLNFLCWVLGVAAVIGTIFYPWCKRFTYLPQVVFGITWNIGTLMAFAQITHTLPLIAWVLYITTIIWSVFYDTFYAVTDQNDDIKIGVKSTALLFGRHTRFITGLLQMVFLIGLSLVGILAQLTIFYWLGIAVAIGFCFYQQQLLRRGQPFIAFLNNNWLGLSMFLAFVIALR